MIIGEIFNNNNRVIHSSVYISKAVLKCPKTPCGGWAKHQRRAGSVEE